MAKINLKNLLALNAGLVIVAPSTVGILADINVPINNEITNQDIVNQINKTTYEKKIFIKPEMTVEVLKTEITSKFIKEQLQPKFQTAFTDENFTLKDLIYNGRSLNDSELANVGIIDAEIKYDYDEIENQTAKFIINKTMAVEDINQAIQEAQYQIKISVNDNLTAQELQDKIDGEFVRSTSSLDDNAKQTMVPNLFSSNSITYNNKPLADEDLTISQRITTTVNYSYDQFTGDEFTLTIIITPTNEEMIEAINKITYQLDDVLIKTRARAVEKLISPDFFREHLSGNIKDMFDVTLFVRKGKIMVDGKALTNADLKTTGIIDAKVKYTYGERPSELEEQEINLKIKVTIWNRNNKIPF